MTASWQLIAPAENPTADLAELFLRASAHAVRRTTSGTKAILIPPDAPAVALRDSAALLVALPISQARTAQTAATVLRALARLEGLDLTAFPAELDLQIYALRQDLHWLHCAAESEPAPDTDTDTAPPQDGLSHAEALVAAPLLWRIGILDLQYNLFLLSGLPRLAAQLAAQANTPLVAKMFGTDARLRYLRHLKSRYRDPLPRTDWSRALGPAGQEKPILLGERRRKDPSIGSNARIR